MEPKRLYKSNTNKIICGVCGGIGEYFGIDPTLIRLALVLFSFTGSSIVAYIVAAIIMPMRRY
ncbi:MAG: PspC domain-containing protein [Eubacteriales bacterium]|nr:PspC domain-containing protein [Eubacteriales bacterium]